MRFLANENFPGEAVEVLRQSGHDVVWIRKESPGIDDQSVIHRAIIEDRILLTFDKDFGELVFRSGNKIAGVILFRTLMPSADYIARIAKAAIDSRSDWAGYFSVIEDKRIRMTPLPVKD
jgi:predicted nuclease of predicted toxin-antitoxin system